MEIGIVGLPNVGKSTLFNAITRAGAECANYPFCTIEPNVGVVPVPDERLDFLAKMENPEKITPTVIKFVDIAGLVRGASKGEGLGNKFLSHIREVDAIAHVVRCFEDPNVVHVDGKVDPVRDIETINFELIFADMETIEKRIDRTKKQAKSGEKQYLEELALLERIKENLEKGIPVRAMELEEEEIQKVRQYFLLTSKPVIYVANISEEDLLSKKEGELLKKVKEYALKEGAEVIPVCAKIEAELAELEGEEKQELLREYGLEESGLDRLIKASYRLLGLITFFTAGPKEVRAWTIKEGTKAPQAAGKIHSDFERGFIRAEVISFEDLKKCKNQNEAKEKGLIRIEGKDYIMKDGDVVYFRFNV
ncbi:redox-regulated ATPase YchF [Thermovenabulum sp.]|uniref:redox-regulated ATPase YchF n=1 Tax=Thermovenabulum sp. TaxID=3100335 RepID=UPI003C7B950A